MKLVILSFSVACTVLFFSSDAYACSCREPDYSGKSVDEVRAEKRDFYLTRFKGAAFIGKVTKVQTILVDSGHRDKNNESILREQRKLDVEVVSFWVRIQGSTVTVYTGMHDGDCGVQFKTGKKYFFIPGREEGKLVSALCDYQMENDTGTNDQTAREFLAIMGEPKKMRRK